MEKGTKVAVSLGIGLALLSLMLIGMGEFGAYVSGLIGNPSGVQSGLALAGAGWLIIFVMLAIVTIIVAVWVYDKLHHDQYESWRL